jgi:ribosomal protein S18 acetylase RimI-like enzyme
MDEDRIRVATAADVPAIAEIVDQAYRHYIARIGKPPGPMLDDYAARVSEGVVWVLDEGDVIGGIIVLLPEPNYLLLDNIAVSPTRQGLGLGRRLLAFAEAEALRRGYREIRLYTHQTMVENQRLYTSIGYGRDRTRQRGRLRPRLYAQAPSRLRSSQKTLNR